MARFLSKAAAPLAVVSVLSSFVLLQRAEAGEGDCSRNLAICDLQPTSTVLRSQIWNGAACSPAKWNSLSHAGYPFDASEKIQTGARAPVSFLNGVCQANSPSGDLEQGIAELQAAQNGQLLPSQRNVASLYEGLLQCRKLGRFVISEIDRDRATGAAFCDARSMAKASFGRVAWTNFELAYEDGAQKSLPDHIEEMSRCYRDYLHGGYDAGCRVISAPPIGDVREVGRRAADTVLTSYLGDADGTTQGDHGIPPLKAMLARKLEMADAALRDSSSLSTQLNAKNDVLSAAYANIAPPYCDNSNPDLPCAGAIPSRVANLQQSYERAVLAAQELTAFVTRWVDGQYNNNGKDVRDDLRKRSNDLGIVLAAMKEPSRPNELTLFDKLERVKSDMRTLSNTTANTEATVRRVCAVYFCELRRRSPAVLFNNACTKNDPATGGKVSDSNKLCAPKIDETFIAPGSTTTAASLCDAVHFPRADMTSTLVDTCMATHHP